MGFKYVSISHGDLGGSGIDALSSEDSIQEGYAEDLVNVDASPQGYLTKRAGYQQIFGQLPVRVLNLEYKALDLTKLELTLDTSIDLSNIPSQTHSRPLVISGRTSALNSANAGDFPNTGLTSQYYSTFTADTRRIIPALPTQESTISIPATEHALTTPYIWVGTSLSTSTVNRDNTQLYTGGFLSGGDATSAGISINSSTYEITVRQQNETGEDFSEFIYWSAKSAVPGSVFVSPQTTSSATDILLTFPPSGGSGHNLTNPNIQAQVYEVVGSAPELYRQIQPESVTIQADSTVVVSLKNNTGGAVKVFCILSTTSTARSIRARGLPGGGVLTIDIDNPPTPFTFVSCYIETSTNVLESIIPSSVVYDESLNKTRVTFDWTGGDPTAGANISLFWEPAYIVSNHLTLQSKTVVTSPFLDTAPQLTIWGLDHSILYSKNAGDRAGWVSHLDTYRSAGNNFLVAGLGGNLFSGRELSTAERTTYKVPTLYPNLRNRVATTTVLGPAFVLDTDAPTSPRTGGAVGGEMWESGFAYSSSINYVDDPLSPPEGLVRVVLEDENVVVQGLGIIPYTDRLTIENSGHPIHDGTWLIVDFQHTDKTVTLDIINPSIKALVEESPELLPPAGPTTIWNSTTAARCGVFTGTLPLQNLATFLPGDILLSENLTSNEQVEVLSATTNSIVVANVYSNETFPGGTFVVGRRASSVMPLRDVTETPSVENLVGEDNLTVTGFARQFKVKSINPNDTQENVTIVGDGSVATVTLPAIGITTDAFALGDRLLLIQAGDFSGEFQITDIHDTKTLSFESSAEGTVTGAKLVGKTAQLDESFTWEDSPVSAVEVSVPGRWIPIEAPDNLAGEAPTTYTRYLSNSTYDEQPILRSTQVADTLFLNNGDDRTLKIDGVNLYRPGLPRWQAELFFAQATGVGYQSIPLLTTTVSLASPYWANNHFNVAENDVNAFPVGTRIRRKGDSSTIYTVTQVQTGTGSAIHQIFVDKTIVGTPAADTLTTISSYSYYFRLNAVDINQNIIASAVTGSYDYTINVTSDFQNRIRLVGVPTLDIYDYDRLEVQIYRTKQNGVAPYYLLTTLPMSFAANSGYIDWIDTIADADLTNSRLDKVNTALKGAELGTGWSPPVRAKHVTSAANRLVLGNLTSDPYVDLSIRNIGSTVTAANLDGSLFLVRKNKADTGTQTDMVNRVGYRFTTDNKLTIQGITAITGGFQVTMPAAHNLVVGNWVYMFRPNFVTATLTLPGAVNTSTDTITQTGHGYLAGQQFTVTGADLPTPLTAGTVYFVVNPTTNTFQLATSAGGTPINLTAAGTGTMSLLSINPDTKFMGWWQVKTVPTTTSFTVDWPDRPSSFSMGDQVNALVTAYAASVGASSRFDVPVYLGEDYNYQTSNGQPSSTGAGIENLATRRWANAVNATQRMTNRTINGQSSFSPWLVANAGGEFAQGQIVLTQPMNQVTAFSVTLPASLSAYSVFANGVLQVGGAAVVAREDVHPSRILISYPNFPEIFDSPFATVDSQSDSALDINPADGQEITACIPFFGSSAFGAALKDAVVVVFKTNSIYVVNLAAKQAGQAAVQRIESQGLGCSAPNSVAPVRDGIMFANASGMYKLRTDLSVYYMGRHMQRQWRGRVSKDFLDLVFGHNWAFGSQYKLSVPIDGSSVPNETFVYNSTREYTLEGSASTTQLYSSREGSWTRHTGFSAIGWCNLDADSFYANLKGQVMQLRQTGEVSDWRDDEAAISMDVLLRATDFGDDGIRKTVPYALLTYRNPPNLGIRSGTQLFYTTDLSDSFSAADVTVLPNRAETGGLYDEGGQKVVTLRYSFGNKRGIRFQLRLTNATKDESVELTRVRYSVAGLSIKGVEQAAQSPGIAKK